MVWDDRHERDRNDATEHWCTLFVWECRVKSIPPGHFPDNSCLDRNMTVLAVYIVVDLRLHASSQKIGSRGFVAIVANSATL